MNLTNEEYVSRLNGISGKKYKLLQDMLSITQSQSQEIHENGVEKLEAFVAEKQVKIDMINKIDDEFDVYFNRLKQELKIKSLEEIKDKDIKGIKELQESIRQILNIINEISVIEKQNNNKANALLSGFGNEIKKLNQGKKINTAYSYGPINNPSYFLDKKK